jgi:hypothetical protein
MTRALSKSRSVPRRGLSRQEAETACTGAETFIYFMRAGEFIKIGRAKNWRTRLSQMQTGSPYTIQPLLIIPADCELEVQLHARFYRDRFRGEWFHSSPAILAYIKDNLPRCIVASGIVEVIAVIPEWTSREVIL